MLGHGGQRGETFGNLFTGLVRCGVCGATMRYVNKGGGAASGAGRGLRLVCSTAVRGGGCSYVSWNYAAMEKFILIGLRDVRYADLFPQLHTATDNAIKSADADRRKLEAKVAEVTGQLDGLLKALAQRPDSTALLDRLDKLELEKTDAEKGLVEVAERLDDLRSVLANADKDHDATVREVIAWLRDGAQQDASEVYERRARLHQLLRRTVDRIVLTPTPDDEHLRGYVDVTFSGVEGFVRRIEVDKGQAFAQAYRAHREVDGEGLEIETDGVAIRL